MIGRKGIKLRSVIFFITMLIGLKDLSTCDGVQSDSMLSSERIDHAQLQLAHDSLSSGGK